MASRIKNSCNVCGKNVSDNQKGIYCDAHGGWLHLRCTSLSVVDYGTLSSTKDDWFCSKCATEIFPFNNIESDAEFLMYVRDSKLPADGSHTSLKFVPFMSHDNRFLINCEELDPDNYFCDLCLRDSDYITCDEYVSAISSLPRQGLSLMHVNCGRLDSHFAQLTYTIQFLQLKSAVVALTETWTTTNTETNYPIPGYNSIIKSRTDRAGGGIALYVTDDLKFKRRDDMCFDIPGICESIFIEIDVENILVGCIYRQPNSDVFAFNAALDTVLGKINSSKQTCYITGDFNLDLIKYNAHLPTADHVNSIFAHSFLPLINRPTRITATTATLIDNIFTNGYSRFSLTPYILCTDIADHLPVIVHMSTPLVKRTKRKFSLHRQFTGNNINGFLSTLHSVDWNTYIGDTVNYDVNTLFSSFNSIVKQVFDCSFPLVKLDFTKSEHRVSRGLQKA